MDSHQENMTKLGMRDGSSCHFFETLLAMFPFGLIIASVSQKGIVVEYSSEQAVCLTELCAETLVGKHYEDLFEGVSDLAQLTEVRRLTDAIHRRVDITTVIGLVRKDLSRYWLSVELRHYDVKDQHYVIAIHRDVSEHYLQCEQLKKLANHDYLTSLPNRMAFYDYANALLEKDLLDNHLLAIAVIDLNRFKPINDAFGHYMGDLLLQEVGRRLLEDIDHGEMVARIGGDEFAMVLTKSMSLERLVSRLEKLVAVVSAPYQIEQQTIYSISASFGLARYPEHGKTLSELLHHADQQMYAQKSRKL